MNCRGIASYVVGYVFVLSLFPYLLCSAEFKLYSPSFLSFLKIHIIIIGIGILNFGHIGTFNQNITKNMVIYWNLLLILHRFSENYEFSHSVYDSLRT